MWLFLRYVGLLLVRVFYRSIAVAGLERLPRDVPLVLVANHPNGLLDPLVARVALRRPIAFLAKHTLFGNYFGRSAMRAFDAIPVFRQKDGADTSKNELTFAKCADLLAARGWLMLFPEGVSHSDPALKPLKTGAARIALGAEARHGFGLGVRIVPLGLLYDDKRIFRSRVALSVGEPIALSEFAERWREDERGAVDALTRRLHAALADVVLEAESAELWNGFVAVAAWTSSDGGRDLARVDARARELARAYRVVASQDPARAGRVVEAAQHYARVLRFIGVDDPFSLEDASRVRIRSLVPFALTQLALAPVALVGAVLGWVPYRVTGILADRSRESDLVGTLKVLVGLVLITATWLVEAAAVGWCLGAWAGLATFVAGPVAGFVAVRWVERLRLRREALRGWWLRTNRARIADELGERRRELAQLVEEGLASVRTAPR